MGCLEKVIAEARKSMRPVCSKFEHDTMKVDRATFEAATYPIFYADGRPAIRDDGEERTEQANCKLCHSTIALITPSDLAKRVA